jgi:hypothetical protein
LRVALGTSQIVGSITAFALLLRTGISTEALVAVCATCLFTTVSVVLFGGRRSR